MAIEICEKLKRKAKEELGETEESREKCLAELRVSFFIRKIRYPCILKRNVLQTLIINFTGSKFESTNLI